MFPKVREWLNKNSAVVTVLAVVLLIVSLGIIILTLRPGYRKPPVVDVYYFDLNAGKTFLAKNTQIPPIEAPTGLGANSMPSGVRAYLFACGDCPKDLADKSAEQLAAQNVHVAWLEMYTPESKQKMEAISNGTFKPDPAKVEGPDMYDFWEQGHMIRAFKAKEWVYANSDQGFQIMQDLQNLCGANTMPKPCFPGKK